MAESPADKQHRTPNLAVCPFCSATSDSEYVIQLHIEESHAENATVVPPRERRHRPSKHFKNRDEQINQQSPPTNEWVKCTRPDCGEYVKSTEIDRHLAVHLSGEVGGRSSNPQSNRQSSSGESYSDLGSHSSSTSTSQNSRKNEKTQPRENSSTHSDILSYFSGNSARGSVRQNTLKQPVDPGRLGKRELGPHAFEKKMPGSVRRHLLHDAQPHHKNRIGRDGRLVQHTYVENETLDVIPLLADICASDRSTQATYLCNPNVRHVTKLKCDGNFCAYWNIQMVLSHLETNNNAGDLRILPNVVEIQETIEQAWENGICAYGKTATGGILGTRKWIGSHDVLAYFTQVGVPVNALVFREEKSTNNDTAVFALLDHIEAYFLSGSTSATSHGTSHITSLPPVYFQRFGHSMTIVGLERKKDGSRNLIVFDPSVTTSEGIKRLLSGGRTTATSESLLKPYRRHDYSLIKWNEFEIVVPQPTNT